MEPEGKQSFGMATQLVVKMRANMADAPYVFEKGAITSWHFHLVYAQLSAFMPVAHHYLAASRLPYAERDEALQVLTLLLGSQFLVLRTVCPAVHCINISGVEAARDFLQLIAPRCNNPVGCVMNPPK